MTLCLPTGEIIETTVGLSYGLLTRKHPNLAGLVKFRHKQWSVGFPRLIDKIVFSVRKKNT